MLFQVALISINPEMNQLTLDMHMYRSFKQLLVLSGLMVLVGCQALPTQTTSGAKPDVSPPKQQPDLKPKDGVIITPYERPEIKRESVKVVLPAQASQAQKFDDGRQLPAFKQLLEQTQTAFKQGHWDDAEKSAMHAQRLAPQSAETFLYLALIANHKNQPSNAESLARRGLSYAQGKAMKKQLWLVIQKAGQAQKNAQTVQEAQRQLQSL